MNDFSFNTSGYVILKKREGNEYYATTNEIWEIAESQAFENIRTNNADIVILNVFKLYENPDTKKFDLTDHKENISFNDLTGVLIQIN